jgi:hypothetical protein
MDIKIYRHSSNIKRLLLVIAIVLIFVLLNYTQTLVKRLRQDSANLIRFYADVYAKAAMDMSNQDFSFIFEEIIKKISTPMILSEKKDSQPPPGETSVFQKKIILPKTLLKLRN